MRPDSLGPSQKHSTCALKLVESRKGEIQDLTEHVPELSAGLPARCAAEGVGREAFMHSEPLSAWPAAVPSGHKALKVLVKSILGPATAHARRPTVVPSLPASNFPSRMRTSSSLTVTPKHI